jgi:hypothetical protein
LRQVLSAEQRAVVRVGPYGPHDLREALLGFAGRVELLIAALPPYPESTLQGILSPSASDPERNKHRDQTAWSKYAIRVILTNPRYTGHQVWNKQRKDEILLDVENVALGTTTKQRWNTKDKWIWSEHPVHDAIISVEEYQRVQDILSKPVNGQYSQRPHPTRRPYAFRGGGGLFCGYCERRMQGNWNNRQAYYRCRFPAQYAIVNDLDHPKVVYLREAEILDEVDGWLGTAFGPKSLERTIAAMAEQTIDPNEAALLDLRKRLSRCDRKLSRYRSTLDAGAIRPRSPRGSTRRRVNAPAWRES